MRGYAALGVTKAWVSIPIGHDDPAGWVQQVGTTVLPQLADL